VKGAIFLHNSENLPLVSVLIPTKNRPHFFEHALKSALNQTYTNIEIIVFDESDNNETEKAIQPYLCQFPSIIRYIKQQAQDGNKNNFHFLYELSSGEFINFLMDDDLFHPEKIEKMMKYYMMDENQEIRIVTSHRQLINEHGDNLPELPVTRKVFVEDTVLNGISFGNMVIKKSFNCIGEPTTVLFRKQDLNDPFGVFNGRKNG
jgi:glycosyltransferase involved in cell wall biosynthesis